MPATVPASGTATGGNVFTAGRPLGSLKANFLDKQAVIDLIGRRKAALLGRFGAFVRARAISSMLGHPVPKGFGHKSKVTDREGTSPPGSPPYPHTGVLARFLYFAYDAAAGGVVVGPMKTNQVFFDNAGRPVTGTVPQVLEYGGRITILEWFRAGVWQRADLRSLRRFDGRPRRYRTATVAARPFMRPALAAELPKFAPLFKDSL